MTRLGEVATYINGFAFAPEDWSENGLPIIRIQDLTGNSYQMNRYAGEYNPKYEVNRGDVLISWSASLGVYVWQGERALLNQHIFKVVFDKCEVDKSFYVHQVADILEKAASQAHGATMKHLTKPVFDALPFYLPDLPTQRRIADTLDKVSEGIEVCRKMVDELDLMVKAKFVEMFGDPVSNPMGWEEKKLGHVCKKLTDGTHFSPESFATGAYKYVTAKNIRINGFDFSNITYIPEEVHRPIYERCNPEYGDVLYIKDGVTTGIAMVNTLHEEFSLLSSVALLKQDRNVINGCFLCGVLNNAEMYSNIRMNMGGAAITRLTIAKLNEIRVIVPPIELQEQFATFVSKIDKSRLTIQQVLSKMEMVKLALMQEYFG